IPRSFPALTFPDQTSSVLRFAFDAEVSVWMPHGFAGEDAGLSSTCCCPPCLFWYVVISATVGNVKFS
ncbi:MAG: hypothetical protein VX256_08650, partial [Pseudomonadota bacterium]|nr:hypothetical protein [Pseudomonadota bacterium]